MPPKVATRNGWKTGEQLEFLFSHWPSFKRAQDAKTLDHFWPRVFEEWHTRWPIPSSPSLIKEYGTIEAGRLMLQKDKNSQIKHWFNNRGRGSDSAKGSRGDLKLDVNEKRKLAAVQAYCAYSWDSILRPIVLTRWEQQKKSDTFDDEDDPPEDVNSTEACIPLAFKLKIAKEVYDGLSTEEKKEIDRRREEDRRKMYRKIPDIGEDGDRIAKLQIHKKNQPMVARSLLRVLSNLEDQAGCVAQVIVASVDPEGGPPSIQKFCQGETPQGLKFETFYGDEWDRNVENEFRRWALRAFGEKGSERRNMFLFERDPDSNPEASSSNSQLMPEASSSNSQTACGASPSQNSSTKTTTSTPQAAVMSGSSQITLTFASVLPNPSPSADLPNSDVDMAPATISIGEHQQVTTAATSENPIKPNVSPSQLITGPQGVVEPPKSGPESSTVTPISSQLSAEVNATLNDPVPEVRYRVRSPAAIPSEKSSRRNSIDGAPDMMVEDIVIGDEQYVVVDLHDYVSLEGDNETHVSSSQKTADESQNLSPPPPDSQQPLAGVGRTGSTRTLPQLDIDKDDLPAWMVKKGQWKYVTSTAGGTAWENLLKIYMEQERRLEFTEMGTTFTTVDRPVKIKEYFQYAHQPSRGDTLTLPDFGVEVTKWWKTIQPEWRRSDGDPPQTPDRWSFILSGGSKGAFLLVLCLAWWDRAHERYLEKEKSTRQVRAEALGVTKSVETLPAHDAEWLKIVNDVAFVMQQAQGSQIPTRGMSSPSRRAKRKSEVEPPAPRKRSTARSKA